jgi:hypothetical protein
MDGPDRFAPLPDARTTGMAAAQISSQ